jgi:nicotinate dehydrogenase subunit A
MSGILVSACALLRNDGEPHRTGIAEALDRNLCRCGSHGRVLGAVEDASRTVRAERSGEQPPSHDHPSDGTRTG